MTAIAGKGFAWVISYVGYHNSNGNLQFCQHMRIEAL
jgi:hypothetical protein